MARDEYRTVSAVLVTVTAVAFKLKVPGGRTAWIPRSLVHGADDLRLPHLDLDEEQTLRIREWKCEEVGLA